VLCTLEKRVDSKVFPNEWSSLSAVH